jgi:hypothetical protein
MVSTFAFKFNLYRYIEAGLEGLRASMDTGDDASRAGGIGAAAGAAAYKALFETSLGAAGDFIKSQFEGSSMQGADANLTVGLYTLYPVDT